MTPLNKVAAELEKYDHPLFEFAAREKQGAIELLIRSKASLSGAAAIHTYVAPVYLHDIEHAQFPWSFQRYLYDCLHDYVVEMFRRSPQDRENRL